MGNVGIKVQGSSLPAAGRRSSQFSRKETEVLKIPKLKHKFQYSKLIVQAMLCGYDNDNIPPASLETQRSQSPPEADPD